MAEEVKRKKAKGKREKWNLQSKHRMRGKRALRLRQMETRTRQGRVPGGPGRR
jgi:hypothetical protein